MLHNTLYETDLTDIYRTLQPKEVKYKFFSNAHGLFPQIDHMVGHKTSLSKFKEIDIKSSIFLDHNSWMLETNLKEKTQKHSNTWTLNNMLLNNEWVNSEIKEEIKKYLKQMKMNIQQPKIYGTYQRQS